MNVLVSFVVSGVVEFISEINVKLSESETQNYLMLKICVVITENVKSFF